MRVATSYPASATATASVVRPASANIWASAHAISAPTTGISSRARAFRRLHRRVRLVHREPVHGEESVDVGASVGGRDARRLVDEFLRSRGVTKCPQHVAGPQEREPGAVLVGQLTRRRCRRAQPPPPRRVPATTRRALEQSWAPVPPRRVPPLPRVDPPGTGHASQTAPCAALTSRSASGARSESRLNVARRTTTRQVVAVTDAASSVATSPRSRRSRLCAARACGVPLRRADAPPAPRYRARRARA